MLNFNAQQQQAIDFKASTVVSAGAGTGKTRTLVGLYLELLRSGLGPDEILAITFTEKAAAEMRDRIRKDIILSMEASSNDEPEEKLWRERLAKLSNAPISTIHSFCGWLLRENSLAANVDPLFTILDDTTASQVRRDAIFETIHNLITLRDARAQALFRDFQLEKRHSFAPRRLLEIVEAALNLLNSRGVDLSIRNGLGQNWLEERLAAQRQKVEEFQAEFNFKVAEVRGAFHQIAAVETPQGSNAERLVATIRSNLTRIDSILRQVNPGAPEDLAIGLNELFEYAKPGNVSKDPRNQVILENLPLLESLDARKEKSLTTLFGALKGVHLAEKLSWVIGQCQRRCEQVKQETRALDFDNLLLKARDLLKFNVSLRHTYKERFKAILVDEFQDTNEVQGELITLLAEDLAVEAEFGAFDSYDEILERIELAGRRLFIVGDPKQSIYRFRQANVGVFVRLRDKILRCRGAEIHLVENYRSRPGLLHFGNWVFSRVMDGSGRRSLSGDEDLRHRIRFTEHDALKPAPNEELSIQHGEHRTQNTDLVESPAEILFLVSDPEARATQGRAEEAKAIASLIESWLAEGRLSSCNQAVLLLRKHSHFQVYKAALEERSIPCHLVKGGGFHRRQEFSDLLSLLGFILDPNDDLLLAEMLTSPFCGLSFNDLLDLSACRKRLNAKTLYQAILHLRSCDEAWQQRLRPFLLLADPLVYLRERLEVSEILSRAFEISGYEAVLMAQEDGAQRVANVRRIIDLSLSFSRRGLASLDEFVRFLRDQQQFGDRGIETAQIISEQDNVVRIMTVHQAKGLEFDTVFLPDLASLPASEKGERVGFDERYGILACAAYGVKRDRLPSLLLLNYEHREADKSFEEDKRLFYVAMTRAKRNLILGEGYFNRARGNWLRWLNGAFSQVPQVEVALQDVRRGKTSETDVSLGQFSVRLVCSRSLAERARQQSRPAQTGEVLVSGGEWQRVLDRVFKWAPSPPEVVELSPTAISHLAKCERYFYLNQIEGLMEYPSLSQADPSAADTGRLVHSVLEWYPVAASPDQAPDLVDDLLRRNSDFDLLKPEEQLQLKDDLCRFLQGPVWQRLSMAKRLRREVPFVLLLKRNGMELFVRGRIDAVAFEESHITLLDYKYSFFSKDQASQYQGPMDIYALTMMKATGLQTAEASLVFLRESDNPLVSRTVFDPEAIEERLLQLSQSYREKVFLNEKSAWEKIERSHCDELKCGFRSYCW